MVPETFWAYLAGFFDGEGSLSGLSSCTLSISQSGEIGKRALERIANLTLQFFPSSRARLVRNCQRRERKMAWVFEVSQREPIEFLLRKMLPYLVVKKTLVEDVLRFWRLYPKRSHNGHKQRHCLRGHLLTSETFRWRRRADGSRSRRCVLCNRLYSRMQRSKV